jgi:hypothetical protein
MLPPPPTFVLGLAYQSQTRGGKGTERDTTQEVEQGQLNYRSFGRFALQPPVHKFLPHLVGFHHSMFKVIIHSQLDASVES